MVYVPDDPEEGEAFVIPLVERCPKLRAIFEAIRHGLPAPDLSECDTDNEQPISTRSKSHSSDEVPNPRSKRTLAPFQDTVTAPTDAECGLPSALSVALSEIPTERLPLSRTLASAHVATVINGHTCHEVAESLAYAANLRRAVGRARAILVIVSSERAVREWIAAMCQALDEVQVISYSRARNKRDATLLRLRQAQYPGIIIAAEKTVKDGIQELWEALRENRIARKWEIVLSEVAMDKNLEGACSPLRMVRDGLAEKGVLIAKKGLTERKATAVARGLRGVDVEKVFWLNKHDIRKIALEEGQKEDEGSRSLLEEGRSKPAKSTVVKQNGRKSRVSPKGKENCLSQGTGDDNRTNTPAATGKGAEHASVTAKSRRKKSDGARKRRCSKDACPEVDNIARNVLPTSGSTGTSEGPVKPRKKKDAGPRAKKTKDVATSGTRRTSGGAKKVISKGETTKGGKKGQQILRKSAAGNSRLADNVRKALLRDTAGLPVKKTTSRASKTSEPLLQPPAPRRRSPRLSPTLSSNESSLISSAVRSRSRKQRSGELNKEQEPVANRSADVKKPRSRPPGSSSPSGVNSEDCVSNSEDENTTWSRKTREKFESRARALRLYSSGSSDAAEEKYYTPPSHAPTPRSDDTTPEKFFSPRTSFSPRKPKDSLKSPASKSRKTPPGQLDPLSKSSLPRRKSQAVKRAAPKPHKSSPERFWSQQSLFSPPKKDHIRQKNRRLDLGDDSSDDQPWVRTSTDFKRKTGPRLVKAAFTPPPAKWSLACQDDSSDDQPLARKTRDSKRKTGRRAVKAGFTPPPVKGSLTSQGTSLAILSAARSKGSGQRSVFEGLLSSELRPKNIGSGIRRTKSFPAPVYVKAEASPPPEGFTWTWGNPKHKASRTTSRRNSLPSSSLTGSILPLKRTLQEQGTTNRRSVDREVSPIRAPIPMRASSKDRHSNSALRRKALVDELHAKSNPTEPEVIIISSDCEDEEVPRLNAISKKRRIFDHDEDQRDLRNLIRRRRGKIRTSRGHTPLSANSRPQDRAASGSGSQSRSAHPNGSKVVPPDDYASFMRGVNRNRKVTDLSQSQEEQYNKYLAEGKRFERLGMRKEAIDSYDRCFDIFDGDRKLISRYMGLASHLGYMGADDFPREPAKSPIKRRSRRRRNSGRKAQVDRSSSRVEVIDLTSA